MINEIWVAFAHRFKDVIAANCLSLPKLEVALFDVCFNMDLLKVIKLLFLCLVGGGEYLMGTLDDEDVEKPERERGWRREETRGAGGEIEFCDGNKALQIELEKWGK